MSATLATLKAKVAAAESKLANARSKAHSPNLSDTTRRDYDKQLPQLQRLVLEARNEYNEFIDEQRESRGFKPRIYAVKTIRRH